MTPKPLNEQLNIIKNHFKNIVPAGVTILEDDKYLIPHWNLIGKTYPEAVQKVMDTIESTRPFYNWRKGQIDEQHIRQTGKKAKVWDTAGEYLYIDAQFGEKYKGKSVQDARTAMKDDEMGLGAYEVLIVLLTHPELLKSFNDLWIDCPGDEFVPGGGGVFACAPFVEFYGVGVRLGARVVSDGYDVYGSASGDCSAVSALVPQKLGTIVNLTLAIKIGNMEICHTNTIQDSTESTKESEIAVTLKVPLVIKITADAE